MAKRRMLLNLILLTSTVVLGVVAYYFYQQLNIKLNLVTGDETILEFDCNQFIYTVDNQTFSMQTKNSQQTLALTVPNDLPIKENLLTRGWTDLHGSGAELLPPSACSRLRLYFRIVNNNQRLESQLINVSAL
jgi:hypothetical protein